MARRRVTRTRKNNNRITELYSSGQWRELNEVINDIKCERHCYYVHEGAGEPAKIHVVEKNGARYLRTDPDPHPGNNLSALHTRQ